MGELATMWALRAVVTSDMPWPTPGLEKRQNSVKHCSGPFQADGSLYSRGASYRSVALFQSSGVSTLKSTVGCCGFGLGAAHVSRSPRRSGFHEQLLGLSTWSW